MFKGSGFPIPSNGCNLMSSIKEYILFSNDLLPDFIQKFISALALLEKSICIILSILPLSF